MNKLQKQFYDFIVTMIVNDNITKEDDIDSNVNQLKQLSMFELLSDEQIDEVKATITSERSIRLKSGALIEEKKHEKWFVNKKAQLNMTYWERYKKYLIYDKKFQPTVVNIMDDILDTLTDLLGNPDTNKAYKRKGLVLGDVQSGKTANYTGLICKAADAKYKVIVLLTGTIESLRKQTQMRLDEGFVGLDSAAMIKQLDTANIGAGKYDPSIHPMVLTSTLNDFKSQIARNLGFNLRTVNEAVLFVVKKNVSVLKHLNKWLRTFNQNGENKIDTSILVIDDEADNASVNTNPEDRDPTSINNQITDLIEVFTKSSYVGFTATPYANIFIDPDTSEQMEKEDLFPKDYIYALNAPTNYIGARDIFSENASHRDMLVEFTEDEEQDLENTIPLRHRNSYSVKFIPKSMEQAVAAFLIANVIRDLRGDIKTHRSMLINVSRFNNVQRQIYNIVNDMLKKIQAVARIYSGMPIYQAERNEYILLLKNTFIKYYKDIQIKWEDILPQLYKSIAPIIIIVVNQTSGKKLDYEEYPDGLRVIAIGGLSLSRGLTLEGLMASYFYRNSKMYDTLMQMGRWFGYRKNYDDLCRIWMTSTSAEWYRHISCATDELRHDIERHEDSGATPLQFGLRVRSDINTLMVTARNKMRSADTAVCTISLSEECIETPDIYLDDQKIQNNQNSVTRLIDAIKQNKKLKIECSGNTKIIRNVNSNLIIDLLDDIEIPITNETFDTQVLIDFINQYEGAELKMWDVVFGNGSDNQIKPYYIYDNQSVKYKDRSFSVINNGSIARISGSKRRLGTISDGIYGLTGITSNDILQKIKEDPNEIRKSLRQKDYFTHRYIQTNRNPQLIIYNIYLNKRAKGVNRQDENNNINKYIGKTLNGFGIGIPKLANSETKYAKYKINKIAKELQYDYDIGDEE